MKSFDLSVYLVLDPGLCGSRGVVETARAAVAGGATMVQLRDKRAGTRELVETGRAIRDALAGSGVPLIVNDDCDAAIAIGAEGLHIGQGDMAPDEARARLGPDRIIGLSAETETLAAAAPIAPLDYLGLGPVFDTRTKPGHKPAIGLDGLARMVAASRLPVVAIGGLKAEHAAAVRKAGAAGMAVVSAICGTDDPQAAARHLAESMRKTTP